jgi:hypothetical protein
MPTCPRCEKRLPHDRLPYHSRYCGRIRGSDPAVVSAFERLDHRLTSLERGLWTRIRALEAELDRTSSTASERTDGG